MLKLLLLADCESAHTIKWATSLAKNNIDIVIFSLGNLSVNDYSSFENITIITLNQSISRDLGAFKKIKYLLALPTVKKIIKSFRPDIVHAHFATSYGLLGAMSDFHPFILSVWGTDIFNFPHKSLFHKKMITYNLQKADKVLSTSYVMKKETNIYTDKIIEVTPFGIDINKFKPMKVNNLFSDGDIIIGTVKTLEEKYGIEYLIKAFKLLSEKYKDLPLKLLIIGGGSLDKNLKFLVRELGIEEKTRFTGKIPFIDIPRYHNMLDISVSVSICNSESFGVAVIEASACSKPVIVSNVGGLPEVVEEEVSGIVVPAMDIEATAKAIERLVLDTALRLRMGEAGRERVRKFYNWDDNVKQMIKIYDDLF